MKELTGFLSKIATLTRARNEAARTRLSEAQLSREVAQISRRPHDFIQALKSGAGVIAEIKRSSPSRGPIAPDLDPVQVAQAYLDNGASAISVLTEPSHFGGELVDLERVRAAHAHAALLMKDFILEPYQILQARAVGADAVLLIVAMLEVEALHSLHAFASELGLAVLVEVHDKDEFETARDLGARLIGVNNRDLKSLKTNLQISKSLAPLKPLGVTLISESGIESPQAIHELRSLGFEGFLIGTALMQDKTPGESLRALVRS